MKRKIIKLINILKWHYTSVEYISHVTRCCNRINNIDRMDFRSILNRNELQHTLSTSYHCTFHNGHAWCLVFGRFWCVCVFFFNFGIDGQLVLMQKGISMGGKRTVICNWLSECIHASLSFSFSYSQQFTLLSAAAFRSSII